MFYRFVLVTLLLCLPSLVFAQGSEGPTNEKAQKTFREAQEYEKKHEKLSALDGYKKADKQDDGHCAACQNKMIKLGTEMGDWKVAETAAGELVAEAHGEREVAIAHYQFGRVLLNEGREKKKEEVYGRAHDEFSKALGSYANFPDAMFSDGLTLAHLNQDEAAKARFEQFVKLRPAEDVDRPRALRSIAQPELARARMAPAFAVTTLEGKRVALDDLSGKVVLIDFWATWCPSCREALPHMRELAKKFEGQPLVVLSISLDSDEQKWKKFIAQNEMTWPQYRDGGFKGPVSQLFGVNAIPHTFTIDADGVLQDEHIGDASTEGKIKKLLARAHELEGAGKAGQ